MVQLIILSVKLANLQIVKPYRSKHVILRYIVYYVESRVPTMTVKRDKFYSLNTLNYKAAIS